MSYALATRPKPIVRSTRGGLGVAPAAAGAAIGSVVPGIGTAVGSIIGAVTGGLFHSSAAGPNAAAANALVPEIQKRNLAAVAAVITRTGIQTQTSVAPWKALLATIPPDLIAAANAAFPGNNWTIFGAIDPSQVLPVVLQRAIYSPTPGAMGPATGPGTNNTSSLLSTMTGGLFESTQAGVAGGGMSLTPLILGGFVILLLATRKGH